MGEIRTSEPVADVEKCPQGERHSWLFTARNPQLGTGIVKACLKCGDRRAIKEGEA
jgi:hypothetical protein